MKKLHYVYVWKVNDIPVYVGKGSYNRWKWHLTAKTRLGEFLRKADAEGKWITCEMNYCESENDGFEKEKELIAEYGTQLEVKGVKRGTLFNRTIGGKEGKGIVWTDELRAKQSEKQKEIWTDELRAKHSERTKLGMERKKVLMNSEFNK